MYRLRRKKKYPASRTNLPNFLFDVATTSRKKKVSSFENKLEKNLPRMNGEPRTENSDRKQKPKHGRSNTEPLAVLQRKNTQDGASYFLYIRYKNPIRFEKLPSEKKDAALLLERQAAYQKLAHKIFYINCSKNNSFLLLFCCFREKNSF